MKPAAKSIVLVMGIVLVCFGAFVGVSAYRIRRQSRTLLAEFRELGTSMDPTASFEHLKRKYGSKISRREGCTPADCQYQMDFSNRTLSVLHIVPYTEMTLYFTTYDGLLRWEMLDYRTAFTGRRSPVVHIEQGSCAKGCGTRFDVNPHGTSTEIWNGLVNYDKRATAQQRDAALSLNLHCLLKFGGCDDIAALLPSMWKHNSPTTVSSRLVGLSQELEESHRFPSSDDF